MSLTADTVIAAWTEELCRRLEAPAPDRPPDPGPFLALGACRVAARLPLAASWRGLGGQLEVCGLLAEDPAALWAVCAEAAKASAAAIAVRPAGVATAVAALRPTPVRVAAAIGWPAGGLLASLRRFAAAELLKLGADELEIIWGDEDAPMLPEIRDLAARCHDCGAALTLAWRPRGAGGEAVRSWRRLAEQGGADYLKLDGGVSLRHLAGLTAAAATADNAAESATKSVEGGGRVLAVAVDLRGTNAHR